MENYKLYSMEACPFCKKVRRFMEKNDIEIEILDINQGSNREDLERLGGMVQVPALAKADGEIMYESSDIIAYMKKEFL